MKEGVQGSSRDGVKAKTMVRELHRPNPARCMDGRIV